MKRTIILPATLATGLLLGACGTPATEDPEVDRPTADSPHVEELTRGINDAGYRIFQAAATDADGDMVMSPLSIGLAFGMLDVGASDNISVILEDLFSYPVDGEDRWSAFNSLEQTLVREGEEGDEETPDTPTLRIANRAFQDTDAEPVEGYNERILQYFGAGIETLALRGDPEGSRDRINAWVADRTEDLIPELLDEGAIEPDAFMILVNALYMKAAWSVPFETHATQDADFTLLDGSTVTVPLMHDGQFNGNAYAGDGFSAIDLPYYGSDLSMLVIAPDAGNYADIEARLGSDFVTEVDGQLEFQPVDFFLPRFESTADVNLRDILEGSLGIDGLFEVAELQGIHPDAIVTDAVHSAKIIVDEEGTEAAAATAVLAGTTSAPPPPEITIRVDNPFLYVIRDHASGAVLFVGRVLDPSS